MKILVTGAAGFIGMHLCKKLVGANFEVIGLDNINSYYDTTLKYVRLSNLGIAKQDIVYNKKIATNASFSFVELDLNDADNLMALFETEKFDIVINLAAQAGVRYSLTNPKDYIKSNIEGFFNILEACRAFPVQHLIYASSSSVYGNNRDIPFLESYRTDEPASLYAATKKSNELMAYTYAHLYKIPSTGLRFFTVYGPYGRPDMAYYSFTKNILEGKSINVYSGGVLRRDFTYVDDIIESIYRLLDKAPLEDSSYNRNLNIGNQNPISVLELVSTLENLLDRKANIEHLPMQKGDVEITYSNTKNIESLTGFVPSTDIKVGLAHFINWYKAEFGNA